jgi:hypothetical protein
MDSTRGEHICHLISVKVPDKSYLSDLCLSARIYKSRFRKWGLSRNLKVGQTKQARQEVKQGKITVPLIRGRLAGAQKLRRELCRKLPIEYATLTRKSDAARSNVVAMLRISSPLATRVDAPADFKYTEACFRAIVEYSRTQFEKVAWDRTSDSLERDDSNTWQNKLHVCVALVNAGKMKDAFRFIDLCLRNYNVEITRNHPALIMQTFTTILVLNSYLPDLAEMILKCVASQCSVLLGPHHPYTRLYRALRYLGMENIRRMAAPVFQAQLNEFEAWFRPDAEFICSRRLDSARKAHVYGTLPLDVAQAQISKAIEVRTATALPDTSVSVRQRTGARGARAGLTVGCTANLSQDFICWAKLNHATMSEAHCRYAETVALLDEIGEHFESEAGSLSTYTKHENLGARCRMAKAVGTYEDIKTAFRTRLDWDYRVAGPNHHWTNRSIIDLDYEYGLHDDVEASAKLQEEFDFESSWAAICEKENGREGVFWAPTSST